MGEGMSSFERTPMITRKSLYVMTFAMLVVLAPRVAAQVPTKEGVPQPEVLALAPAAHEPRAVAPDAKIILRHGRRCE
ncbi:MAG TPA: hypothetical protein VE007_10685, partial [Thermoanaerobaculia bacterium]|nr:hypothetical protein [Thermoanaerobaculia bacterium]